MRVLKGPADHVAVALLLFLSVVLHLELLPYAFDDAYIHFRIAANLLRHGEPYYNLGQAVLATSSPLWTVLLAPLSAIPSGPLLLVAVVNATLTCGARVSGPTTRSKLCVVPAPRRSATPISTAWVPRSAAVGDHWMRPSAGSMVIPG